MRKTRPLPEGTETGFGAAVGAASDFLSEDVLRGGKSSVYQQKEGTRIVRSEPYGTSSLASEEALYS